MATNGWIGEQTVHSWGSYNSRLTTNVYINGIKRYSDHIDVSGVIYLFCKSSGAKTVWYDWAITAWCGGGSLGQIKPRTYNNNILGKSWSKNFSIRINCSNSATSATFQVGFSDSNMGGKDKYWTLYFDRYATSPSGISSTATYTQYSTISTSCSGINWGQGYSNRSLTCTASYTYNGKTENFTLGTWSDGATSKSVTKSDFNFPADLNVTIKWTASTNIGSTSSTSQVRAKQTFPAPNLNNITFTAESIAPYCIRVNVSGVDFGDNYSARKLELYGTYELDGIIYDNKLGEISNQTSWTLEYDASQEAEPWTKIPDDSSILLRLVADNGNRTSDKTIIINCQSSYEAYVIESISDEEKEKSEEYEGTFITLNDVEKDSQFAEFKINGDTSQQTYTGKNLLPNNLQTQTSNYVTFTKNTDGSIKISGTATARTEPMLWQTSQGGSLVFTTGKTYKNTTSVTLYFHASSYFKIDSGATYSPSSNQNCDQAYIRVENGETINTTIYPQIIESGVNESYEPFVGGIASPNPDYPQAIRTVTNENDVTVVGKNLCGIPNQEFSHVGLTISINDGVVTINGTSTGTGTRSIIPIDFLKLYGTYTTNLIYLSGTVSGAGCNFNVRKRKDTSVIQGTQTSIYARDSSNTWELNYQEDVIFGLYINPTGVKFDNFKFKIQITRGSEPDFKFEHYRGNAYQLNLGKNLFDKDNANIVIGTVGSTATTVGGNNKYLYITCDPNTTYTVQKRNDGDQNRFCVASSIEEPINAVPVNNSKQDNNAKSITITTGNTSKYLVVMYYRNAETILTEQQLLDSIQIEKGSIPTEYATYFEPIELCKIGTYQDYIYKSGEKWYVRKEIGSYTFDGSEAWSRSGSTTSAVFVAATGIYLGDYIQIKMETGSQSLFDRFIFNSHQAEAEGRFNLYNGTDYYQSLAISFDITDIPDITAAKAWLASNTPTFYGILATPVDIEITNLTLITQLENLIKGKIYKGIDSIISVNQGENKQAILDFKYYTKWQNTSPAILSANGRNGTGNFKQVRRIGTK